MKIERIDDKTVKCFLSNEELEEYDIDYEEYKDKKEYIDEVQSINHLAEEDSIRTGQTLIVPYYSYEFVK